jgi:hypothetical protein
MALAGFDLVKPILVDHDLSDLLATILSGLEERWLNVYRPSCHSAGWSRRPAVEPDFRIELSNLGEPAWIEQNQLSLVELQQSALAQLFQSPAYVDRGQPGGIGDVDLVDRQMHRSAVGAALGGDTAMQVEQQVGHPPRRRLLPQSADVVPGGECFPGKSVSEVHRQLRRTGADVEEDRVLDPEQRHIGERFRAIGHSKRLIPFKADKVSGQGEADDLALAVLEHLVSQHPAASDQENVVEWITLMEKRRPGLVGLEMDAIGKQAIEVHPVHLAAHAPIPGGAFLAGWPSDYGGVVKAERRFNMHQLGTQQHRFRLVTRNAPNRLAVVYDLKPNFLKGVSR